MEASAIFIIAHLRGLNAVMVCAVSGNLVENDVIYEDVNYGSVQGWENAIQVALEGIASVREAREQAPNYFNRSQTYAHS